MNPNARQFSLRTLLYFVVLICVMLAVYREVGIVAFTLSAIASLGVHAQALGRAGKDDRHHRMLRAVGIALVGVAFLVAAVISFCSSMISGPRELTEQSSRWSTHA
jgi:cytochrome b561